MSNLSAAFLLFEAASNTEIDDKRFHLVDQSSPDQAVGMVQKVGIFSQK